MRISIVIITIAYIAIFDFFTIKPIFTLENTY